MLHHCSIL